ILRLYVDCSLRKGLLEPAGWGGALDVEPARPKRLLRRVELGLALLVVGFGVLALAATIPFNLSEPVQVTAHRGYSRVAPENALAAVRKALEAGAEWAEIDVQETADGEVVVLHDRDLLRMTGDKRRLAELTLAELRRLRVRPDFGPKFAGE